MIRNYFLVALRQLQRRKVFTAVNVLGLTFGLTAFLLIMEYVAFEWSFNRFHVHRTQLYRVLLTESSDEPNFTIPPGLGPVLQENLTGVVASVRMTNNISGGVVTYTDPAGNVPIKSFREDKIDYVDGNFLEVFTFPLQHGQSSLARPGTLALSASQAKKYFGKQDPIGKTLRVNNQFGNTDFEVTAVFEDMPAASDLQLDILLSMQTLATPAGRNSNDWAAPDNLDNGFANTYLLLHPDANPQTLEREFAGLIKMLKPKEDIAMILQPLLDMHLAPSFDDPLPTFGNLALVAFLLGIAVLILLIAWVNYVNLSTAQSLRRAREVGIRKAVGAQRGQLVQQYLLETLLLTGIAVLLAFGCVQIFQNYFNDFTGKDLSLHMLNAGWFWAGTVLLVILSTLTAGGYVAGVVSSFEPVKALRSSLNRSVGSLLLRKGLVVFQFVVSICLIISTTVLYRQLSFMKQQDLGMQLHQLMAVPGPVINSADRNEKVQVFKNALAGLPFIDKYSASNGIPSAGYNFFADGFTSSYSAPGDEKQSYGMLMVDERYFDTYGITLAAGKTFTPEMVQQGFGGDYLILNEKAARTLGFEPAVSAVGQRIRWGEGDYEIQGVVKDYHHASLQQPIGPIVFIAQQSSGYFTMRITTDYLPEKIAQVAQYYNKSFPGNPFDYFFLDDRFNQQYQSEQQFGKVFTAASALAIFIACLGLFGLTAYAAESRIKEIGIRKVLGATVQHVVLLLSRDFLRLVIIALLVSVPLTWYAAEHWLQGFAYRTEVHWWLFAGAGAVALSIAWLTVSFHAIKAALANPVDSLRNE